MTYTITFTQAAKDAAARHHILEAVEERARKDIDGYLAEDGGLSSVDALGFHVVCLGSYFDETLPQFVLTPDGNGGLNCDLAEFETFDIDEGQFSGKSAMIPKPVGGGSA